MATEIFIDKKLGAAVFEPSPLILFVGAACLRAAQRQALQPRL
jgi:hypothetical protein